MFCLNLIFLNLCLVNLIVETIALITGLRVEKYKYDSDNIANHCTPTQKASTRRLTHLPHTSDPPETCPSQERVRAIS